MKTRRTIVIRPPPCRPHRRPPGSSTGPLQVRLRRSGSQPRSAPAGACAASMNAVGRSTLVDSVPTLCPGEGTARRGRGLTKRFGDFTAVDAIDFEVGQGEAFGFLGPNGAGKSSTMRMIAAVSPVTGGTLRVLGLDPGDRRPRHPGPARRRPPGGQPRPRAHRLREPPDLRPLLRAAPGRHQGAGRRAARLRAAHRAPQRPGRSALGRHEAPAHHRPLARQRPGPPPARRADDRASTRRPATCCGTGSTGSSRAA